MIAYDVQDLVKYYPGQTAPANDHITLQVQQGEIFGLLGDNGAGKTTLVRQMVNLLCSSAGHIRLFDQDITHDPLRVAMMVGYTPQDTPALNNLTVDEALYFTAHLRGLSSVAARQERQRLLEMWDIGHLRRKYSPRLSGGEKRLLRLAVAMAGSPPVLILDEPTRDLDPLRRKQVWDVLRRMNGEQGTTVILVTHDAIEAEKIIQRVGIMRAGKLAALGRPAELKRAIDQKMRLELFFSPDNPPRLPEGMPRRELEPGRWFILLERSQMASMFNSLPLDQVDDFRLYSATLEDLYLHYATQS
jgi:ABC-type multidrug transport system ATPase subunit